MRMFAIVLAIMLASGCLYSRDGIAAPLRTTITHGATTSNSLVHEARCAVRRVCGVRGCVRRTVCW